MSISIYSRKAFLKFKTEVTKILSEIKYRRFMYEIMASL